MRDAAVTVVRRLQEAGFEACWVGGCVRDMLRGLAPKDYDIATSARPEQVERIFPRTVPVGRQFGVILVFEAGHRFEVATFRIDATYLDGRHPDRVDFGDARADALRRDFTVNGLFYDPLSERLFDWVGGEADLRARLLRTIGSPELRFREDHLRLLRAVRFAAQLGFELAEETFGAVRSMASLIQGVAAERVREELSRLFSPPHAARGLELLRSSGLLAQVLPEVEAFERCEQSASFHPEGSVFNHVRRMLELMPSDAAPSLPWAVLLHDVGKPATASTDPETGAIHFYGHERVGAEVAEAILRRLRFPRRQMEEIVFCVRHHMQFKDVLSMRASTLRRLLMRPTFALELELHRLDCLGSHGRLDHHEYLVEQAAELAKLPGLRPPLLNGRDLMELGMRPGVGLGAMLGELRERQLQGELVSRDQALEWARGRLMTSAATKSMGP